MARPLRASITFPEEARVLSGLYASRLAVAYALALAAAVVRTTRPAEPTPLVTVIAVVVVPTLFTLGSWFYARRRDPGPGFLSAQVSHDLLLTTAAVLITGGIGSEFALFYVLVIGAAGFLLGFRGAMGAAGLAVLVYLAIAYFQIAPTLTSGTHTIQLPNVSGRVATILWSIALTVVVFLLVGLAAGIVGRRVRTQRERLLELEQRIGELPVDAKSLLNTIESGVLTINERESVDFVNVTARSLLGISGVPEQTPRLDGSQEGGLEAVYRILVETLRSGSEVEYQEVYLAREAEEPRPFGVTTTLLYDPRGRKRGAVAIVKDVESAKRLEELTRQTDRLRAVNELAAGLAHEIQNPLAAIRSAVELLGADEGTDRREMDRLIALTIRETDRLTDLIDDFKTFSGMKIRRMERLDLSTVVEDALEVDRVSADGTDVEVNFTRPQASHSVDGDHNLLKQVCLNLISNARAAVSDVDDPRIDVRVGSDDVVPEFEVSRRFVALEVRDNGPGIDPKVRERIFDPFVTTRSTGVGMGLAIVHRIVQLHGGIIWVDSEQDRGARFRVAIPRAQ